MRFQKTVVLHFQEKEKEVQSFYFCGMKYKILGRTGLRVSEICLGTMTFGTAWGTGADYETSKQQYLYFLEQGGNFLDTANRYTEGTSEKWLGEFVRETQNRDELVIATKYSLFTRPNRINDGGNHRKNMVQSIEQSLKRLQMDYIDILYLHAWDFATAVEEVMRGMEDLVRQGKVLYIGFSDTPAWVIARAQTLAELRAWQPISALQLEYSLITRDIEREFIPMAVALGMSVLAWAPLAGGALTGKYLNSNDNAPKRLAPNSKRLNERSTAIAKKVVDVAKQIGASPAQVALKWTMQNPIVIPIVGARTLAQLQDSLQGASLHLPVEHLTALNEISTIELGFPYEFLQTDNVKNLLWNGLQDKML